jgi:hypothetical protein
MDTRKTRESATPGRRVRLTFRSGSQPSSADILVVLTRHFQWQVEHGTTISCEHTALVHLLHQTRASVAILEDVSLQEYMSRLNRSKYKEYTSRSKNAPKRSEESEGVLSWMDVSLFVFSYHAHLWLSKRTANYPALH